jgi:ribosomal protein L11 methyltransferase
LKQNHLQDVNQTAEMNFIQVNVRCSPEFSDILIAELAELEFDSFEENTTGFTAYVEEIKMEFESTKNLFERYSELTSISYGMQKIAKENWNQEWENNFPPIVIGDKILVKTPFHKINEDFEVVLTVVPKMSFGTGHHATTSQMLSFLLTYKPDKKHVIDAGTGTGILAVMAEKMGAISVLAFDNDPWCIENSIENFGLNSCSKCSVKLASSMSEIVSHNVETLLANINKNVILKELPQYSSRLNSDGLLFLSGFYVEDIPDIEILATSHQLRIIDSSSHDNWACLVFQKTINL